MSFKEVNYRVELEANPHGEDYSFHRIYFKSGYKYQLEYAFSTRLFTSDPNTYDDANNVIDQIETSVPLSKWVSIYYQEGGYYLWLASGYAWDGPSGPTIDDRTNMVAAIKHDALYQLINIDKLPIEAKKWADDELYLTCRHYGMNLIRAKYYLWAVRRFAKVGEQGGRPLLTSP